MNQHSACSMPGSNTDIDQDADSQLLVSHLNMVSLAAPVPTSNPADPSSFSLLPSTLSRPASSFPPSCAVYGNDNPGADPLVAGAQLPLSSATRSPDTMTEEDQSSAHGGTSEPGTEDRHAVTEGLCLAAEEGPTIFDEGRDQERPPRVIAGQPAAALASTSLPADTDASSVDARHLGLEIERHPEMDRMISRRSPAATLVAGWTGCWNGVLNLDELPNEVLMHILCYLEVCDLLATSRINHHFRNLSLHPFLHNLRLRQARLLLPPLLTSPSRPTLRDLIARHIFLTNTTQISRRLARNLVAIRLSRRLPLRPSAEILVQRGVLPSECIEGTVAPGLVAKKRAVERERLKDGLRRWVGAVWKGEVRERSEGVRQWEERAGVGRVWRLRRFWERVGRGDGEGVR